MEEQENLPEAVETKPAGEEQDIAGMHDFYTWEKKNGKILIHLDKLRIIRKLKQLGFLRYDTPDGSCVYVHTHDRKLRLTSQTKIVDAFEDYILRLPDRPIAFASKDDDVNEPAQVEEKITKNMILEALYAGDINKYFGILDRLRPDRKIELVSDMKEVKYYYFNNVCIAVSKDGMREIPYSSDEITGYIWESAIINRDFTYTDRQGDFESFCKHISNDQNNASGRFTSLMSILGYLTHDFYETDLKAVFLTDVNKEQAGKAAGRTGKGLLGKACSQVLNRDKSDTKYVAIPGKGFSHNDGDGTCYSMADISTQLIHIEDIDARHFSFDELYNDITDGAKIRRKHKDPIIKFCKFMLSSNQTISLSGSSSKGRVCIFELSNYYSDRFRPSDEFKKRFFESEWTDADWNEFYSFMVRCSIEYMRNGLQEAESVFYNERRVVEQLGQEITDFIKDLLKDYSTYKMMCRTVIPKPDILTKYQTTRDRYFSEQKRVTGWFRIYCDTMGIPYKEKRSTTDNFILYPSREDFI